MARIPTVRKDPIPFRSRNRSEQQNQFQEDVFFDLAQLFTELNGQQQEIAEVTEVLTTENKFLQMRLIELEDGLKTANDLLSDLQAGAGAPLTAVTYVTSFRDAAAPSGVGQAMVDELHRIATLPPAGAPVSKVYLPDALTGEPFLPQHVEIQVDGTVAGAKTVDTNLRAAFDGHDDTVWVRKVIYPLSNAAESADTTVTLMLPDEIISNREINTITIHPFPAQSVDIVAAEYCLDSGFHPVPGFTPVQDAGPVRLCFASMPASQIRITLRQRHWIEEGNDKVFYLGAHEIGVFSQLYAANRAEFAVPVTLHRPLAGDQAGKYQIRAINPVVANAQALSGNPRSLFSYNLFVVDPKGNLTYTQEQLPVQVTGSQLLLQAALYADPVTGATPALEAVEVEYVPL